LLLITTDPLHIETITLLNSIPYSKTEARKILQDELGWEYYDGHHYESVYTRFVYSFWLPHKFGIDKRIISLSALVRNREITRENTLLALQEPIRPVDKIEEDVESTCYNKCMIEADIKAYKMRWKAVEQFEREELQSTSIDIRWQKINTLLRIAVGLGLQLEIDYTQDSIIYERWAKLKRTR